jgi:hypothetical protein
MSAAKNFDYFTAHRWYFDVVMRFFLSIRRVSFEIAIALPFSRRILHGFGANFPGKIEMVL